MIKRKPPILVTGAAGFIGSFLSEELVKRGHFVLAMDNFFRGKRSNLASLAKHDSFLLKEIDLSLSSNIVHLHQLIKKHRIEIVFHLAAINGTQYFYDKPFFVLDQNIKIVQNLLLALTHTEVHYIIYTSSSEVYGEPLQIPTREDHPIIMNCLANRDSYAASKAIGEYYIRLFAEKHAIKNLILRVFNMYGERMVGSRYGQVIPEFIQRILCKDPFTIIGDGSHSRSFCYIRDAVWAIGELLEREKEGFLNIGNNQEMLILTLAKEIHKIKDRKFCPRFLPERPYDHKRRCPDLSRFLSIFPGFSFTPIQEGLKRIVAFYESEKVVTG